MEKQPDKCAHCGNISFVAGFIAGVAAVTCWSCKATAMWMFGTWMWRRGEQEEAA